MILCLVNVIIAMYEIWINSMKTDPFPVSSLQLKFPLYSVLCITQLKQLQ
jgi:hypothetical protein